VTGEKRCDQSNQRGPK